MANDQKPEPAQNTAKVQTVPPETGWQMGHTPPPRAVIRANPITPPPLAEAKGEK
jgi:hypothetical protein